MNVKTKTVPKTTKRFNMSNKDNLGDRMKYYEQRLSLSLLKGIPILARVDGRAFHSFTKGLERPYDKRLSDLMIDTTKFLVKETNARCGYVQSDEISLVWLAENQESEIFFNGKLLKICSIVGSLATAWFNNQLGNYIPEKASQLPIFDSRVWEIPVYQEAVNYFIWREQDATRNSIQMAAQNFYSHKELHGKNSSELQELLFDKGVNWNDYPNFFKRGTYVRRRTINKRAFSQEELADLPLKHHAHTKPDLCVKRTEVVAEDFMPLTKLENGQDVILFGAEPVRKES